MRFNFLSVLALVSLIMTSAETNAADRDPVLTVVIAGLVPHAHREIDAVLLVIDLDLIGVEAARRHHEVHDVTATSWRERTAHRAPQHYARAV